MYSRVFSKELSLSDDRYFLLADIVPGKGKCKKSVSILVYPTVIFDHAKRAVPILKPKCLTGSEISCPVNMVFFTEIPGVFFALPYEFLFPVRIRGCRVDAAYITAKRETILAFAGLDSLEISSAFVHRDPVIPFTIAFQEFSCFTVIAA